jgi:serine/threonine-protein kinase
MLQVGSILNERYEIIEKIGSGGMSIVYKAKDTKLERYVAIKVLREEFCLDENFVKKFKVEAQSAASLSHQNIVNIYDVGNEGRTHFIVMEYLEGQTLKDYIKEQGQIQEEYLLKIALSIASALENAHINHIIHRDIKPQNIILTKDGKVKVADFGIARIATDQTLDAHENPSGSVYYIAPEQARGGYQDHKSDIYSLGITMYEMATGKLPFSGDNPVNVALKQIHDPMPKPSDINAEISPNVETIILKATEKKTSLRYQNTEELIEDLKLAMTNPEDILVYTNDMEMDETLILRNEEMKHIWNKQEVNAYSKEKDPLEKVVVIGGILLSLVIVSILVIFVYNNYAKKMIPEEIEIPNVMDMELSQASEILKNLQLDINVTSNEYHTEIDKNHIISQSPQEGTLVLADTTVEVTVSKGIQLFTINNVVQQSYDDATKMLENSGFTVEVIPEYSDVAPTGTVIRQDPLPNESVAEGTLVTIYVSQGPEITYVEVPQLENLDIDEAQNVLTSLNLEAGNITYIHHDTIEENKVVSMSVDAGREVAEGYVIDLAVSLGREIRLETKSFVINNILDHNQEECELKVVLAINGEEKTLFNDVVTDTDFPMTLSATETGEGIIHVYNDGVQQYEFFVQFTEEVPNTNSGESNGGNE